MAAAAQASLDAVLELAAAGAASGRQAWVVTPLLVAHRRGRVASLAAPRICSEPEPELSPFLEATAFASELRATAARIRTRRQELLAAHALSSLAAEREEARLCYDLAACQLACVSSSGALEERRAAADELLEAEERLTDSSPARARAELRDACVGPEPTPPSPPVRLLRLEAEAVQRGVAQPAPAESVPRQRFRLADRTNRRIRQDSSESD